MKLTDFISESEYKTLYRGNRLEPSEKKTVLILYKIEGDNKKPVARYSTVQSAYDMLHDLENEYPDDKYVIEWNRDYPSTMYESKKVEHNPIGVSNWNEIKRAMNHRGPDNDALHNARLKFDRMVIPLDKSNGDLNRLYKWVKNHLGNNEQTIVFDRLGNLMQLDKLIQSMKPPKKTNLDERRKKKTKKFAYSGWYGIGDSSGSEVEESTDTDNSKVWMISYIPIHDIKNNKTLDRRLLRKFFKNEDDALVYSEKLRQQGHDVYTPTYVSKRNMSKFDKLR